VFPRLRWGGQLLFVSAHHREVDEIARRFDGQHGFRLDGPVGKFHAPRLGLLLPIIRRTFYYMIARKIALTPPGEFSARYSYHVELGRCAESPTGYRVSKEAPSHDEIYRRLTQRFPQAREDEIVSTTRKLVEHVLPICLTREAAFLKILGRQLANPFSHRVPRLLDMEQDDRGMVRRIYTNWLRMGGDPLSHFEFARQSAELLRAMHDTAKIIHLDLRLDNVVVANHEVAFVDFGSAVRVNENLNLNPMLKKLYETLVSRSKIQRVLGQMLADGRVTSSFMRDAKGKISKAMDVFYLTLQMNRPHGNPDLKGLVRYNPGDEQAKRLSELTAEIFRPSDADNPRYVSAMDLYKGIERIGSGLRRKI
jgi:hypothetical protein